MHIALMRGYNYEIHARTRTKRHTSKIMRKIRLLPIFAIIMCYALLSFAQSAPNDTGDGDIFQVADAEMHNDSIGGVVESEAIDRSYKQVMDSLLRVDSLQRDSIVRRDSIRRVDSIRTVMRKKRKPEIKIITVTLGDSSTINFDSIKLEPSLLFMPLIFERQESFDGNISYYADSIGIDKMGFDYDTHLLDSLSRKTFDERRSRYRMMLNHPDMVYYNLDDLPEPPKQYEIYADPSKRTLKLEETNTDPLAAEIVKELDVPVIKMRNWIHTIDGSLQFSQAYISENWYQGGDNNLNILGNFTWNVALNQNAHPNLLFDNTVQYKIGLSSAPQDSLRNYSISEDLLQVNTKFGYKAIRNWYYSLTMQFKTQLLNNYAANSNTLNASFLTPGELNLGLGMTYGTKSKNGYATFDLSIAPLSYNLKICRENDRVDPTSMGVDAGKHVKGAPGSNIEAKLTWAITPTISWSSRIYAFTDYDYVQGDWENTFNFSINKYLSTQLYLHLRYDDSTETTSKWGDWQMKEILSFGLKYRFAMN